MMPADAAKAVASTSHVPLLYKQITLCHEYAVHAYARVSRDQGGAEVTASLRELPRSSIQACW